MNFTNNFINAMLSKTSILKNYHFFKNVFNFIKNYKDAIINIAKTKYILDILFIKLNDKYDNFLITESIFFNLKKFFSEVYSNFKTININYENIKLLVENKVYKINIIKDWFLLNDIQNKNTKFILFKAKFKFYFKIDLSEINKTKKEIQIEISNLIIKIKSVEKIYNLESFLKENIENLKEKSKDINYAFGFCFDKIIIRNWKEGDYFKPYGLNGKKQKLKKFFINNKFKEYEKSRTLIFEDQTGIFLLFNYINKIKRGRELFNNLEFLKFFKENNGVNFIEIWVYEKEQ